MSKCSLINFRPGWDTRSAVADSCRATYTFPSARQHKRLRMFVPVRAGALAQRAYVHTIPVHNTTLLREESKVSLDQTREFFGPQPARKFPTRLRVPSPIPTIMIPGVPLSDPPTASNRAGPPRVQTAYMSDPCYHYAPGPVQASSPVSKGSQPYHQLQQVYGKLPMVDGYQTLHLKPGSRPQRETMTTLHLVWEFQIPKRARLVLPDNTTSGSGV